MEIMETEYLCKYIGVLHALVGEEVEVKDRTFHPNNWDFKTQQHVKRSFLRGQSKIFVPMKFYDKDNNFHCLFES